MDDELPDEVGAVDTPENPGSTVDYEKRWKDTHANWNTLNEQMSRFKQDPDALIQFIQENHPDLIAGEDPPEDEPEPEYVEEDPTADLRSRVEKFETWQAEQVNKEAKARFTADLTSVAGDRAITKKARDWIELETSRTGNNRAALEKAVESWFEDAPVSKPKPKTAPHVARGRAAAGGKAWSEMTREEALQAQLELAASLDTQV